MENIINILLYNCDKKNTRTILSLSNVCKSYHNILNSIVSDINATDIDSLSPREALEKLYTYDKSIKKLDK